MVWYVYFLALYGTGLNLQLYLVIHMYIIVSIHDTMAVSI